jgi:hypothetical protein
VVSGLAGQRPDQRMLACPGTDDENLHQIQITTGR